MMRKAVRIALVALAAVGVAACTPNNGASAPNSEPQPQSQSQSLPEDSLPPIPMDTALYRGVVSQLEPGEASGYTFVLTQVEGVNYGFPSLHITTSQDTLFTFDEEELREGSHVEVYYGGAGDSVVPIQVNLLPGAEDAVFNGEVTEVITNEDGTITSIMVENWATHRVIIFDLTDRTQVYLNLAGLEVGERLNIFHSGAVVDGNPQRGEALEIRPYYEA